MTHASSPGATQPLRADVQALRALAVALVLLYHFWPSRVPGGYIGVDVFFVISGFLITSHLLREPPTRPRQLAEFWGRRIRRLLPASFTVLAVTLVATVLIAPATMWENVARHATAAALYVENWLLASDAVDYLAADIAPTPVQHLWSLAVEEQFYLVWPVLILVAVWLGARVRAGRSRTAIGLVVAGVVVASLATSVALTGSNPPAAYFVSWTRFWELGAGALLACGYDRLDRRIGDRQGLRLALVYAGIGLIVWAAFAYSGETAFPGIAAAAPVVGAMLVIAATVRRSGWSPLRVMELGPVQFAGDTSYSLYLWHWPILVLAPLALDHALGWPEKVAALAMTVVLAWATKVWIEDRYRGRRPLGVPLRRSFAFAATGMLVVALASGATAWSANAGRDRTAAAVAVAMASEPDCVAAGALLDPGCDPHGEELITDPVFAANDRPDAYADGCWVTGDMSKRTTCTYGNTAADATKVALVGNSHAGHWLPALQEIAEDADWSITTYLVTTCYTVEVPLVFDTQAESDNCLAWNRYVIDEIASGAFDLVVFSNRTSRLIQGLTRAESLDAAQPAYARVLERWRDAGVPVLVLRDNPNALDLDNVPDCVAQHLDDLSACDGDGSRVVTDPLAAAAAALDDPNVQVLDLTDRICRAETCYSVVGGVIVYFDQGHLTATFSRSMAAPIRERATALLSAAGG